MDGGANSLPTNIMAVRLMSAKSDAESQRKQEDIRNVLIQNLEGLKSYKAACKRQMETDYTKQYELAQERAAAAKNEVDDGMARLLKGIEGLIDDRKRKLYAEIDQKTSGQIARTTEKRQNILARVANTQSKAETLLTQDRISEESFNSCCEEILTVLKSPAPTDSSQVTVQFYPLSLCNYGEVTVVEKEGQPTPPGETSGKLSLFGLKSSTFPRRRPAVKQRPVPPNKPPKPEGSPDSKKSGVPKGLNKYLQKLKGILPSKSEESASPPQSKTVWFNPEDDHSDRESVSSSDKSSDGE